MKLRLTMHLLRHLPLLALSVACASPATAGWFTFAPKELVSTFHDSETMRPLEGVFVMAQFREGGSRAFSHAANWCVRTAAFRTNADGVVRIPRGGAAFVSFVEIKSGYRYDHEKTYSHARATGDKQVPPTKTFLARQNAGSFEAPQFLVCNRPKARVDLLANIQYMQLRAAEIAAFDPRSPEAARTAAGLESLRLMTEQLP